MSMPPAISPPPTIGWSHSIVGALALVLVVSLSCAADSPPSAYQVKAAFIYNFTQFVEWPESAFANSDAPFIVAVVGEDPFKGTLDHMMDDKLVGNRAIQVKHFSSASEVGFCHLLFVPAAQNDSLNAIFGSIGTNPILTVGESDEMMAAGGGIQLFLENGRMRFQINPDALDAAKLKASAKLLKLARIYRK